MADGRHFSARAQWSLALPPAPCPRPRGLFHGGPSSAQGLSHQVPQHLRESRGDSPSHPPIHPSIQQRRLTPILPRTQSPGARWEEHRPRPLPASTRHPLRSPVPSVMSQEPGWGPGPGSIPLPLLCRLEGEGGWWEGTPGQPCPALQAQRPRALSTHAHTCTHGSCRSASASIGPGFPASSRGRPGAAAPVPCYVTPGACPLGVGGCSKGRGSRPSHPALESISDPKSPSSPPAEGMGQGWRQGHSRCSHTAGAWSPPGGNRAKGATQGLPGIALAAQLTGQGLGLGTG